MGNKKAAILVSYYLLDWSSTEQMIQYPILVEIPLKSTEVVTCGVRA